MSEGIKVTISEERVFSVVEKHESILPQTHHNQKQQIRVFISANAQSYVKRTGKGWKVGPKQRLSVLNRTR